MAGIAAKHGFDARRYFLHIERLGDEVVRAELKTEHLVEHFALCRYHNDRLGGHFTDLAADLPAIFARHHNVEKNKIRFVDLKSTERLDTVVCGNGFIAFVFEINLQKVADICVIVCNKNFVAHCLLSSVL